MPRANQCLLGYDDLMCELPNNNPCPNWMFCRVQMAAWEIPYECTDQGLFVKSRGSYSFSHCNSIRSNFSYPEIDKIISDAWYQAGWAAAEYCDPIPF